MLSEHQVASAVMDCGRKLLQDVYEAQVLISRLAKEMKKKIDLFYDLSSLLK